MIRPAAGRIMTELAEVIIPQIEESFGVTNRLSGAGRAGGARFWARPPPGHLVSCRIYLVLAWIFASWTRPMVVMAIIPFGLVGAIYGHMVWDVRCRCSPWSA